MRFDDPIIRSINYNKELFDFLKKIFPDARAVPKTAYYFNQNTRPKIKASVIICPLCNYHSTEDTDPVIDIFLRHVKKAHRVIPRKKFQENLKATIRYLRISNRIPYTDPFIYVPKEALYSK